MEPLKVAIYSVMDLLVLGKGVPREINGFKVRFPARWSRYFEADYEKENLEFLKKNIRGGAVIVDVGAHLGLLSVISSKLAGPTGKVYAFEPSPDTFEALKKVCDLNPGHAVVECMQKAVSDKSGEVSFFISSDKGSNSNSLVEKHQNDRKRLRIPCTTIDAFVEEKQLTRLDLIKIDAEGSEIQVLQGAERAINAFHPLIVLAVHPSLIRNNAQEPLHLFRLIQHKNYRISYQGKDLDEASFCSMVDFFDVHLIPENRG